MWMDVAHNPQGTEAAGRCLRCVHMCDWCISAQLIVAECTFPYSSSVHHDKTMHKKTRNACYAQTVL